MMNLSHWNCRKEFSWHPVNKESFQSHTKRIFSFHWPRSILWGHWYPLFRTLLPMGFKAMVDSSLPALFSRMHTMLPRVISGCRKWVRTRNLRREQYHCASPVWRSHIKLIIVANGAMFSCPVQQGGHIQVQIKFPVFSLCSWPISLCFSVHK